MRFKRRLAGLASVGALVVVGALTPSAAVAHPCIGEVEASLGTSLTLHTGGTWAGYLPAFEDLEHECAADVDSYLYDAIAADDAAADPVSEAVSTFTYTSNLQPIGYSARNVPMPNNASGAGLYNSDLAFKDNYVIAGTYAGFRIIDATDKANPVEVVNYTGCAVGQGDVVVYGNLLVRSWDAPANASATCAGMAVGQGFEGIHIFDISNPAQPQMVRQLRMASSGNEPGAPNGCGSHTATAVPDPARGFLYIYNGGSSGTCNGIDVVRISLSDPTDAKFLRRVSHGRSGSSCHDNNVLMNVGGGTVGYAMCAGGNGLAMYAFDMAKDADAVGTIESPGGVENPTLLWSKRMPDATTSPAVTTGHSGSFTYDGKYLVYGHEPGGGSAARCQATSTVLERTLFFMDPLTGDIKGTMVHPRPQTADENCTWHNFNVVPTKGGYFATVGSYQSGISIVDFTNPAVPKEIAYADPAPLPRTVNANGSTSITLGGDWSTYWHNGHLYESDIKRGVIIWKLSGNAFMDRTNTFALSNPQTQAISYAPDNTAPTASVAAPVAGGQFLQNSAHAVDFSCADDVAVESCVGTVADGANLDTSKIGYHEFTVTATDTAGNQTTETVEYVVNSTAVGSDVGAAVAPTLALVLGTSAQFGAFTPGVAREYTASTTATVISTAGDGVLSVSDPSDASTGRLVNGAFSLTSPLSVSAASAGGTAAAGGAVGGASAPTSVLTYGGPVSNDAVTLTFKQAVGANEALRTGTYSKSLTFTLWTTTP